MIRPRKAVILSAGYGARMLPLSADVPKPLMPLWGEPAVVRALDLLERWGVREVLLNLHHRPGDILACLRDRPRSAARVTLSFEPAIVGTGGALRRASWFLDGRPFWVLNADVAADLSPGPLLSAFNRGGAVAALWVHPSLGPRTVEVARGRVTCFRSRAPGSPGTFTFCGLQVVSPDLQEYFPPGRAAFSIVEAYERAMAAGRRVAAVAAPDGFWADLGTPRDYLDAHARVLEAARRGGPGARLFRPWRTTSAASGGPRPPAFAGRPLRGTPGGGGDAGFLFADPAARIGRGARVEDCVLWSGAAVRPGGTVVRSIVGRGAAVKRASGAVVVRADRLPADRVMDRVLARLGWAAAETTAVVLEARGSARAFTRLERGARSVMLVRYDLVRPENGLYAAHAAFLRGRGIPVPRVVADLPADNAAVMEDLGDLTLEQAVAGLSAARREAIYRRVLEALLRMHAIPGRDLARRGTRLEPPFSESLYRWERELLARHTLRPLFGLSAREIRGIMDELEGLSRALLRARPVLVHRDMQSSNILLRGGRPWFLDFQGMRMGPAAYDVASLLCDPYVMLRPDEQGRLLLYYARRSPRGAETAALFWAAVAQRLAQALGAFGRLAADHRTRRFAGYIRPGLQMMDRALERLDGMPLTRRFVREALSRWPAGVSGG